MGRWSFRAIALLGCWGRSWSGEGRSHFRILGAIAFGEWRGGDRIEVEGEGSIALPDVEGDRLWEIERENQYQQLNSPENNHQVQ